MTAESGTAATGPPREYDVIVLGGGSTGEVVGDTVVRGGLSAVLVEAELVGGECSYWACMPSKALLRPGQALAAAGVVDGAKQAVRDRVDVPAVLARRDGFTSHWKDDGQVRWLEGAGLQLVRGRGRIAGPRQVVVRDQAGTVTALAARHAVVVATGSVPAIPSIDGLAEARPWTSREATSAHTVPDRLLILGGGVVGVEMATAYTDLGARQITLIERSGRLLAKYEPFVSDSVADALRRRGVDVRLDTQVARVARATDGGSLLVTTRDGERLDGDELLVALGRRAATSDLGLEQFGLEPGNALEVDDTLRVTGVPGGWLYAAGDVNGRALLTHQGKYQARQVGAAIVARAAGREIDPADWGPQVATADRAAVPQVVFTDPEVAAVGLTEAQARERGLPVRVAEYEIGDVAGAAVYADGYAGHAKMVVDTDRDVVVGVTLVGPNVGEMLHAATVMVVGEVPIGRLWHAVPAYPTISELWLRLLETYRG
ncbi:MAG TPA: NAD(P)/FAD-dependent oxidoreductase [Mycobacteriales bacterium]|nr:NAD(P)/FAD-dependent oxidoreductase [Mycobacteriales bacterium]